MPYKDPKMRAKARKRWKAANPEKVRKSARKYQVAHSRRLQESKRKRREDNPEQELASNRKWRAKHPERVCAKNAKRRALKAGNGGSYTGKELQTLYARYDNQCIGPGPHGGKLEPDHVIPVIGGGSSNISNIQPLCGRCNRRKGTKTTDYRRFT